jgi:hypothetical protein
MDGMSVQPDGDTGFANETSHGVLGSPGLWAQLPPCPPWPDLN